MYYLQVRDERGEREVWLRPGHVMTVGRSSASDVVVFADDASREHAELRLQDGRPEVRDLGTRNGTWLKPRSGTAEEEPRQLAAGAWHALSPADEFRVGNSAWLTLREAAGRGGPSKRKPGTANPTFGDEVPTLDAGDPDTRGLLAMVTFAIEVLTDRNGHAELVESLRRLVGSLPGLGSLDLVEIGEDSLILVASTGSESPPLSLADAETCIRGGKPGPALAGGDRLLLPVSAEAVLAAGGDGPGPVSSCPKLLRVLQAVAAICRHVLLLRHGAAVGPGELAREEAGLEFPEDELLVFYRGALHSKTLRELLRTAARAASTDTPVLLQGETGVGKEYVASFLHDAGDRSGAFVAVNASALSPALFESELFGHVAGAFTDAKHARSGRFVEANGGTLFLDEITELPLELQPKLLRALAEGSVRPVGGGSDVPVDVRVVAATNRDMDAEVAAGRFRADLYYRLSALTLNVPPLRERPEEIRPLAEQFLAAASEQAGRSLCFDREAIRFLLAQPWPGNLRQLENVVSAAALIARGEVIRPEHLGAEAASSSAPSEDLGPLLSRPWAEARQAFERAYFERLIETCGGSVGEAAKLAETDRGNVYKKLRAFGLREAPGDHGSDHEDEKGPART